MRAVAWGSMSGATSGPRNQAQDRTEWHRGGPQRTWLLVPRRLSLGTVFSQQAGHRPHCSMEGSGRPALGLVES